jgi:hypothetical protein
VNHERDKIEILWEIIAAIRISAARRGGPRRIDSLFRFAQFCQHAEIFQRGRVAGDLRAACNLFEQASHDLAAARFWQRFGKANFVRLGDCADVRADVIAQFCFQFTSGIDTCFQRHKCDDALTL